MNPRIKRYEEAGYGNPERIREQALKEAKAALKVKDSRASTEHLYPRRSRKRTGLGQSRIAAGPELQRAAPEGGAPSFCGSLGLMLRLL